MEKEYYEPMKLEKREDEVIEPTKFYARGLLKIVGLENERYYIREKKVSREAFEAFLYGRDLHSLIPVSAMEQRQLDTKVLAYECAVLGGDVDFTLPSVKKVEELRAEIIEYGTRKKQQDALLAIKAKEEAVKAKELAEYQELRFQIKVDALEEEREKMIKEEATLRNEEASYPTAS